MSIYAARAYDDPQGIRGESDSLEDLVKQLGEAPPGTRLAFSTGGIEVEVTLGELRSAAGREVVMTGNLNDAESE